MIQRHRSCFMFHFSSSASPGFTLVEVLVAMALLTTALVPAFVLATNAVSLSTTIRNSLIASNLAQEGAEITRAMRDANWFASVPFQTGLDVCSAGCAVQFDSTVPITGALVASPLRLDPVTGLYQYSTGNPTLFTRSVTVTAVSPQELRVVSLVTWRERGIDKSSEVEYHLYDWIQ
jgi:prepilin-type N-terminal cleavage/methylation domain-containing protein